MFETIQTIFVKIGNEELEFNVPVKITSISVRSVTRHSNVGIDIEYIVQNKDLSMNGKGGNEKKARKNFQDAFIERYHWCRGEEGENLPVHKIIEKIRLEQCIVTKKANKT